MCIQRHLKNVGNLRRLFVNTGENIPLRACGTRFVCHKVHALERILDKFGAYLHHLIALSESPSTKSSDREVLLANGAIVGYC